MFFKKSPEPDTTQISNLERSIISKSMSLSELLGASTVYEFIDIVKLIMAFKTSFNI